MKKNVLILLIVFISLIFMACPIVDNPGGNGNNNNTNEEEFKQIVIGGASIYVLKTDGSLWVHGYNNYGQLGLGDTSIRSTPTKVLDNVEYVSASTGYSMIIKNDNSLWASGDNSIGQFGNGTTTNSQSYIKIRDNVKKVSCSEFHSIIIDSDDKLLSTGKNTHGQLGDNSLVNKTTYAFVNTNNKTVVDIDSQELTSVYLTSDNELYGFGDNSFGQLAQETIYKHKIPVLVASNVKTFSVGETHVMYVDNNDDLYGLGRNYLGEIGNQENLSTENRNYEPFKSLSNVKNVSAGQTYTMVIKNDNSLWAVGSDSWSKQGDGNSSTSAHNSFYEITESGFSNYASNTFNGASIINTGNNNTIVKTVDEEIFVVGSNNYGELGQGSTDDDPHGLWAKLEFNESIL